MMGRKLKFGCRDCAALRRPIPDCLACKAHQKLMHAIHMDKTHRPADERCIARRERKYAWYVSQRKPIVYEDRKCEESQA